MPELVNEPHDMHIAPQQHGVDAVCLAVMEHLFDFGSGKIVPHLPVQFTAPVRKAAERIAAYDQTGNICIADFNGW